MSKLSREKGKRGEREIVNLAKAAGIDAERTAPMQAGELVSVHSDVSFPAFRQLHLEVKRDERMSVDAMIRQAEADADECKVPVVLFRRNGKPWHAVLPLDNFFDLLKESR